MNDEWLDGNFLAHPCYVDSMGRKHINRKEIPVGTVVYFLHNSKSVPFDKDILFGIVEEHYIDCVALQMIEPRDMRTVQGIPVKEFVTPTRWQKLPKGWTYSTDLVGMGWDTSMDNRTFDWTNPEDILRAYHEGILVNVRDNDHAQFEADLSKSEGYRIIRKYPMYEYHPDYMSVDYRNVFLNCQDAEAARESIRAEFKRQAALSEYDWSVEQIDKELDRWAAVYGVADTEKQKYRDWLLARDKVEDIEVRISQGQIQWKYWKNKKWMAISP